MSALTHLPGAREAQGQVPALEKKKRVKVSFQALLPPGGITGPVLADDVCLLRILCKQDDTMRAISRAASFLDVLL